MECKVVIREMYSIRDRKEDGTGRGIPAAYRFTICQGSGKEMKKLDVFDTIWINYRRVEGLIREDLLVEGKPIFLKVVNGKLRSSTNEDIKEVNLKQLYTYLKKYNLVDTKKYKKEFKLDESIEDSDLVRACYINLEKCVEGLECSLVCEKNNRVVYVEAYTIENFLEFLLKFCKVMGGFAYFELDSRVFAYSSSDIEKFSLNANSDKKQIFAQLDECYKKIKDGKFPKFSNGVLKMGNIKGDLIYQDFGDCYTEDSFRAVFNVPKRVVKKKLFGFLG